MRRLAKWLLVAVAAVVVLTVVALAAIPRIVDTPRVQSLIASGVSQVLGRPVKFQSLSVSVLPYPAVRLHALEIAEDPGFGGGPFLQLDTADLRLKLSPLLRGRAEFAALVLKQPRIVLIQGSQGQWNFASLGAPRETATVPRASRGSAGGAVPAALVSRVVIDRGLVTYEVRGRGKEIPRYRLEDLDLTLSTRAAGLSFAGAARVAPGEIGVKLTEGTLGLSGVRTIADASVRARVALDGKDVRPLVAAALGPEPSIGGALTGRLDVTGTVGRPRASGDVELRNPEVIRTSPACAEPKRRTLSLSTVKANLSWEDGHLFVQPLSAGIAGGSISMKVAAPSAADMDTEVSDIVLKAIPLERVLVDFLCQGYALAGPLDLTGTLGLSPTDPWRTLSGNGLLRIGGGKVVGPRALALLGGLVRVGGTVSSALSLDVPTSMSASPVEFDSITGSYRLRNGIVTTRDLLYTSRTMKARVAGDYALATGQMNLDVMVDLGRGQVQAKVAGTAASPSIRVVPATVLRQVEPEKVERGLKDLLKKFR